MTKIKICGLRSLQDIALANKYKPDFVGFVFAASKRKIDAETAGKMKRALESDIKAVGVFVNENHERIAALCNSKTIDIVQLHGDEDEDYIMKIKGMVSNPIIKAIRPREAEDIVKANVLSCDYLLFDTYSQTEYGGTGKAFGWEILKQAAIEKPYFLAGGISAKNIDDAMRIQPPPFCIDVSSGLETGGRKDENLMQEFMELYKRF